MLRGESTIRDGVAAPPGGVDDAAIVAHVRAIAARLWDCGYPGGHWMIVADGEAVGLIGFKAPPSANGDVDIGYGIAASRRRRGHATRAVGLVVDAARRDPAIRAVVELPGVITGDARFELLLDGLGLGAELLDPVHERRMRAGVLLSELLEAAGHEAIIVDGQMDGLDMGGIKARVAAFRPDFTVVTTAPSYLFWRCAPPELRVPLEVMENLRDVGGTMVAVGPHASTTPRAALRKLREAKLL